jgi:hypothetical protein
MLPKLALDRGVGEIRSSSSDRTGIFQECLEGWREHDIASFDRAKATVATSPIERMRAYLIGQLAPSRARGCPAISIPEQLPVERVPEMLAAETGTWFRCPLSRFTNR